ncbi:MAG TPA: type II secretion system protein GspM [Xanthobacteraceae bacterium]|nr:type II secretion system protein GspM [Xanthobacteraceae bacterium]
MIARIEACLVRYPAAAVALYAAIVVMFVALAIDSTSALLERRAAAAASAELLGQLEARGPARAAVAASDVSVPTGSPFVEGATVSIAGATLLRRITAATTRARGNLLSTQVDLQGPQSKAGFITVTSSFEIEATALQDLLYDIEAGMPFLFVGQMVVQAPSGGGAAEAGRLRVLLSVSGQWQGK